MDWKIVVAALLITTSATPGVLQTPPNDPPEADAGLDQQVPVDTTVLLDATGSYDPDGTIEEYSWQIQTPTGDTVEPACATCPRTRFPATSEGTYNVTLTVTDDDGATRIDSLYVTATPDDGPDVALTGPREATPNTTETFRATPEPGSEPIVNVDWTVDGTALPVENTTSVTRQFETTGERTITVTVTDAIGRISNDSLQVRVDSPTATPQRPNGGNGTTSNGTDPNDPDDTDEIIVDPNPGNGTNPNDTDEIIVDPNPGNGTNPDDTDEIIVDPNPGNGTNPDDTDEIIVDPNPGNETNPDDTGPGNGITPDDPPNGADPTPVNDDADGDGNETTVVATLAGKYDPTIAGPQLVTGDEPLEAEYAIDVGANPENVTRIRWSVDDDPVATSPRIDVAWTPGRHTLEAEVTYSDDSTDIATFGDDSTDTATPDDDNTTVVADPAPELLLDEPTVERGDLTGAFDVTDDYGNIENVTLTVDDTTLFGPQYPPTRRLQLFNVRDDYRYDDLEPSENYTVKLTSTDRRGQKRTTTRTIQSDTGPEIISIGFKGDTVDSYHPRIRSERYTATHVVEIELNGIDRDEITIENLWMNPRIYELRDTERSYDKKADILTITSLWAGDVPDEYKITSVLRIPDEPQKRYNSTFKVTPSPPELRLTSSTDGTRQFVQEWGMVIDASRSFDPDEHGLNLKWLNGAKPLNSDEWAAKLTPTETAGVRLIDETGAYTEEIGSFLPYYVPRLSNITQKTSGPYNGSEEVVLDVWTAPYAFTKNERRYNISLGARSNSSDVDVVSVRKRRVPTESVEGNNAIKQRLHRWVATVRVSASDLNEGKDWITFYNEENPQRIYVSKELGDVNVQFESKKRNLTTERTSYRVQNESGEERLQVREEGRYRRLLNDGWDLVDKRKSVEAVSIETLEPETDTVTRTREFEAVAAARRFAAARGDWSYAGKESSEETETVVVSKWTRDPSAGRPTGETRQVVSNPNAYVTHHQYRYTTTKQVTETREVSKRVPVTVEVEKTVDEKVCHRYIGCFERTKTVTVERKKVVKRTVTVEREVTRRVEHTYWARRAHSPSHSRTGNTKRVRTEPKEYHTEYLVTVPQTRTVTTHRYEASKTVQKTYEEWTYDTEVESMVAARALVSRTDSRIGNVERDTEWIVAKSMNTTEVVRTYDDEENVLKTYATVTGTLIYGPEPDQQTEFTVNIEMDGYVTNEAILDEVEQMDIDCDPDAEDCYE
jgi:hypothetical protein